MVRVVRACAEYCVRICIRICMRIVCSISVVADVYEEKTAKRNDRKEKKLNTQVDVVDVSAAGRRLDASELKHNSGE